MPGAVLHVSGCEFDPDTVLPALTLQPYRVFRKGEIEFPAIHSKSPHPSGGFCCDVSMADGLLSAQAGDAVAYLTEHYADLARLRDNPAIDDMLIDFGYDLRLDGERVAVQCDILPHELLRLAGELHIGFALSLYPRPK